MGIEHAVFEAHTQVGGCAGFFRHKGFAFYLGATTLVDFEPGGAARYEDQASMGKLA